MSVARLLRSSSTVSFHQSVLSARDVNSRANGSTKGPRRFFLFRARWGLSTIG
jgi:hypothetical protein